MGKELHFGLYYKQDHSHKKSFLTKFADLGYVAGLSTLSIPCPAKRLKSFQDTLAGNNKP